MLKIESYQALAEEEALLTVPATSFTDAIFQFREILDAPEPFHAYAKWRKNGFRVKNVDTREVIGGFAIRAA